MIEAYKILINNALQRYHFELANRGATRDEGLRNSLRGAIMGLYNLRWAAMTAKHWKN
ncbi:DUF4754 family protein [Escherichia coli]